MTNKQRLLGLLFNGILLTAGAQTKTDNVQAYLLQQMKERSIPGLQFAIVQHGKIIQTGAYGLANIELDVPVTSQTVFSIASATKSFTGTAVMQLVEEGLIDLSAPLSRYLDSLPATWQPVTIKQLLTHVSGIPNIVSPATSETIVPGAQAAWDKVRTLPMEFTTGEKFSYNQTNYLLLGRIIDKLSGQPFSRFITTRQFDVVGMPLTARSGFNDTYAVVTGSATLYSEEQGKLTHNSLYVIPPFLRTGSGISSSAEELARWIIALQQGKLFKSPATLGQMWTPGTYKNGKTTPWALGWPVRDRPEHFAVGGFGGNRSVFFVYPNDDLAVIILTNLAGCRPESFVDEVAAYYIQDMHEYNGFGLDATVRKLNRVLRKRGFDQAVGITSELTKSDTAFQPEESQLNLWGYALLGHGEISHALAIFKLNTILFPASWNVYDSYGEALLKTGNKQGAIKMYQKSVELNPGNENGKKWLEQLGKEP